MRNKSTHIQPMLVEPLSSVFLSEHLLARDSESILEHVESEFGNLTMYEALSSRASGSASLEIDLLILARSVENPTQPQGTGPFSNAWLIALVLIHDFSWIARVVCVGEIALDSVDSVDGVVSKQQQL